jgi:xanthosine phosphorylase
MSLEAIELACHTIRLMLPKDFKPQMAIILGSGLGQLGEHVDAIATISYKDIPGFHASTVAGHKGMLIAGYLKGLPVICLQGRVHFYEGASIESMQVMIRTLKFLGCSALFITNASGSLRPDVHPGRLMVINDHINFAGINPLVGMNEDSIGPRFTPMDDAYDPALRARFQKVAQKENVDLAEGVYFGVLGPTYETPAEIRAFRILGAGAIGMSTVAEVILAKHCGLAVVAVAVITNLACGLAENSLSHEETLFYSQQASGTLIDLVEKFAADLATDLA